VFVMTGGALFSNILAPFAKAHTCPGGSDAVWWGGALSAALIGAGLLRLGDRIPDPHLQAQCPPPQAVSAGDMDSACQR
jgi:hypothetical protein